MSERIVHVVFKTHLDLGFTDTAQQVCAAYVEDFIPRAMDLAEATRERGEERFVWTTGAWLIDYYLRTAQPRMVTRMEDAIESGDIVWHGLPFTTHTELMSPELFVHGLSISRALDKRFGTRTISAKMTDVPGHTRSMIPYLADHGIAYLHVGVNPASSIVDCPPRFRWCHPDGAQILVSYGSGYDAAVEDVGAMDLLHFAHTGDNHGPPTAEAVAAEFSEVKDRHPGYRPIASSLDRYARALIARRENLPIIQEEFGDTWIHGIGADPGKVARYRCVDRFLTACGDEHQAVVATARQHLLLVPEHTWGKDEKSHLKDYVHYGYQSFTDARTTDVVDAPAADEFRADRDIFRYSDLEASWQEQRAYVDGAVGTFEGHPLQETLRNQLHMLEPSRRTLSSSSSLQGVERLRLGGFDVRFCHHTGALASCVDQVGEEWAANGPLAQFRYQCFDAASFDLFLSRYNPHLADTASWAVKDFTKPGLECVEGVAQQDLSPASLKFERDVDDVWVEMVMPAREESCYGAPRIVQLHYHFGDDEIEIDFQWFDKAACRLPEASWIGFGLPSDGDWMMEKMGTPVSPLDVARGGNRALHALDSGRVYQSTGAGLCLESVDAPLFSPGRPRILEFDCEQPELAQGWHINLHNNHLIVPL